LFAVRGSGEGNILVCKLMEKNLLGKFAGL
jgi:hypothetical protein